jgi:hypothetical protein
MGEYKLIYDGSAIFVVNDTDVPGRQPVRRFETEVDALMWVAEQGLRDGAEGTADRINGRSRSSLE